MGDQIREEQILSQLMQILSKSWNYIPDNSSTLLSLFECFEVVIVAIGPLFEPFSANVYSRCIKLLQNVLTSFKIEHEIQEQEVLVRSIDLISAIFTALQEKSQFLVASSNLVQILLELLESDEVQVRQYIFALAGDMQKCIGDIMKPHMPQLIEQAIANLAYKQDDELVPSSEMYGSGGNSLLVVCNNACWCIGEIAVAAQNKDIIKPYISTVATKLITLISCKKLNKSLA
mmetsp:Transcript_40514/g.39023  ORF Transcript_40514/g.39023 Transcript_40514/m.39023 type:complete len:232 (-) Transcript_40514:358-1053(-)